jgi:hypothetical protein
MPTTIERHDAPRPPSPAGEGPPAAATALAELAEAFPARLIGRDARRMRRELRRRTGWTRDEYRVLWEDPEASLGPFEDLPRDLRAALADAVAREMAERSFVPGSRLDDRVHGFVFHLGSEIAHRGRRLSSRGRRWRRAGRSLYLCGRTLCWASERVGRAWIAATRFVGPWETSGFHALWKWAGVDPTRPAIEYVRGLPCDPRITPVYRDPGRRVASWMMVGLDLLPSDGEAYFIEANINPGFYMGGRYRGRPEEDPILAAAIAGAGREGCERIVVFPSSVAALPRFVEEWWKNQVARAAVGLEIRDDPRVRSQYRRATDPVMAPGAERTLFVNIRTLPHPINVLLEEKGRFEEEIERHNARVSGGEWIPVPRRVRSSEELPPIEPGGRFPNLVVKHALLNEARDVRMYRISRLEPWMTRPPHVAFEFVPPELEERSENGVHGEYATRMRANLFITPDGPVIGNFWKGIAGAPVPDRLEEGEVANATPYMVNGHAGARHLRPTEAECERMTPAALRIGWLVHDVLRRLHGPGWP